MGRRSQSGPIAYQSHVYLKSIALSGRQQTEGPQAVEQFRGKSHSGIWIMSVFWWKH